LFLSRELTFAQGMNIAGFEFGCAITVRFRRSTLHNIRMK